MDLSQHLKHLLYNHDCVIVPNLGGFVCSHKKLEFNIHTGLVHPPRKTVAFNQNLNNNDGLLANHIIQKEKVGHAQALENINAWVSNLNQTLQRGETINIDGLGSFSLNNDKRILFIPFADVNFSTETYGLYSLQLNKKIGSSTKKQKAKKVKPVVAAIPPTATVVTKEFEKEPTAPSNKKETVIDTTPAATIAPKRKKRTSRSALRKVSTVLLTLLVFFAFFIYQDYAYHSIMDKGSLFSFGNSSSEAEKADTKTSIHSDANNGLTINESESISKSTDDESSIDKDVETNSLENSTVTQPSVEISKTETAETDSVFYIIAGAFSSESNAKGLLDELNSDGFAPEIIKSQSSSLYRVGYQRYPSRKKAEGNLNSIRNKTHNFAAWVLAVKP